MLYTFSLKQGFLDVTLYYYFITSRSNMQHVAGQILAQKGQKRSRLMGSVETVETISWLGLAKPPARVRHRA